MSSAVVVLPKISAGARISCTCAVSALSILGGLLVPTQAEAATSTVVGQGTYENDDAAVTLNGTWTKVASSQDSGGSTSSLNGTGYAELSFKTSGIRWITRKNAYSGIADVYLDGVKKTTVDLYSSTTKTQQVVYEVTGLSETTHTIRVVRTGTKNASSTSTAIHAGRLRRPRHPRAGRPDRSQGGDRRVRRQAELDREQRARPQGLPRLPPRRARARPAR